jgi:hypothetical protein
MSRFESRQKLAIEPVTGRSGSMGIIITCCCGKRLVAPDSAAGQRGRCSKCGRTVFVPTETDRGVIYFSGDDLPGLEAAIHQAACRLVIQDREAVLDEAEKWAKAWKLPPDRKPLQAGFDLTCDSVVSCVQRDATVGMERASVLQAAGEEMLRVSVTRQEVQLLHFVARIGEDEFLSWHHRDAEDEEADDARQKTDIMQSLSTGVHCELCDYNIGYVRLLTKAGLVPIVGYRCTACNKLFCSKCHGKYEEGCPACGAPLAKLQYLARRTLGGG